jgi:hypothetical protein
MCAAESRYDSYLNTQRSLYPIYIVLFAAYFQNLN